jgi:hypothetical protein
VNIGQRLEQLFEAERSSRRLHDELVSAGRGDGLEGLLAEILKAVEAACQSDAPEATVRLVCLARLLGEFEGPAVADALIDVLNAPFAEARHEAGEQLQGLAFDRFKEVALAAERALERFESGSPALVELPYVLVEVPEPGVLQVLAKYLDHEDPDAVAAAIEALVEVGDPGAVKLLEPLVDDERRTTVAEEDAPDPDVTVGELAGEAIELLRVPEEE